MERKRNTNRMQTMWKLNEHRTKTKKNNKWIKKMKIRTIMRLTGPLVVPERPIELENDPRTGALFLQNPKACRGRYFLCENYF